MIDLSGNTHRLHEAPADFTFPSEAVPLPNWRLDVLERKWVMEVLWGDRREGGQLRKQPLVTQREKRSRWQEDSEEERVTRSCACGQKRRYEWHGTKKCDNLNFSLINHSDSQIGILWKEIWVLRFKVESGRTSSCPCMRRRRFIATEALAYRAVINAGK